MILDLSLAAVEAAFAFAVGLFLPGWLAARLLGSRAAWASALPLSMLFLLMGGLFVLITLSVIAQVGSFKLTGKRVLRMAPLHHHFEMLGWAEVTIVVRFWLIQGLSLSAGLALFYAEWIRA